MKWVFFLQTKFERWLKVSLVKGSSGCFAARVQKAIKICHIEGGSLLPVQLQSPPLWRIRASGLDARITSGAFSLDFFHLRIRPIIHCRPLCHSSPNHVNTIPQFRLDVCMFPSKRSQSRCSQICYAMSTNTNFDGQTGWFLALDKGHYQVGTQWILSAQWNNGMWLPSSWYVCSSSKSKSNKWPDLVRKSTWACNFCRQHERWGFALEIRTKLLGQTSSLWKPQTTCSALHSLISKCASLWSFLCFLMFSLLMSPLSHFFSHSGEVAVVLAWASKTK